MSAARWVVMLAAFVVGSNGFIAACAGTLLIATVFAAVYHAEVVAHRTGEPFGTLVLAVAVTVIEVALIVSVMMGAPAEKSTLPRDTVFAAVMIVCNGIVGLCLLWGYCGVLSFGQVAYVGIAGYVYGIIAGNLIGNPWGPLIGSLGGLAACAVVAAIFGYFADKKGRRPALANTWTRS